MIKIYTDGACSGNPGPGGWGAVIISDSGEEHLCGGDPDTTNNKMELCAAINALNSIPENEEIELFTDSNYVKNGITSWIHNWKRNGWKNSQKEPVKNQELWIQLDKLVEKRKIHWNWVRGHTGDHFNEIADQLARSQCK